MGKSETPNAESPRVNLNGLSKDNLQKIIMDRSGNYEPNAFEGLQGRIFRGTEYSGLWAHGPQPDQIRMTQTNDEIIYDRFCRDTKIGARRLGSYPLKKPGPMFPIDQ